MHATSELAMETATSGFEMLTNQLDTSAGLVSFAALFVLVFTGAATREVTRSFKTLVHVMVYLDCIGFMFFYTGITADPTSSSCSSSALWFFADFAFAMKDGARIAYILYRGFSILGQQASRIVVMSGVISVLLYMALMIQTYRFVGFANLCSRNSFPMATQVMLNLHFLACELFSGGLVLVKFYRAVRESSAGASPSDLEAAQHGESPQTQARSRIVHYYRVFQRYEAGTLLLAICMQIWVSGATLVYAAMGSTASPTTLPAVVLRFSQLFLLLSGHQQSMAKDDDSQKSNGQGKLNSSSAEEGSEAAAKPQSSGQENVPAGEADASKPDAAAKPQSVKPRTLPLLTRSIWWKGFRQSLHTLKSYKPDHDEPNDPSTTGSSSSSSSAGSTPEMKEVRLEF